MLSYGCWCNFYTDRHHVEKGLGRPLDGIDLACHHWQQCHQCTKMDDMDCVPLLVEYDLSITATKNSYGLINQKVSCEGSESGCAKCSAARPRISEGAAPVAAQLGSIPKASSPDRSLLSPLSSCHLRDQTEAVHLCITLASYEFWMYQFVSETRKRRKFFINSSLG